MNTSDLRDYRSSASEQERVGNLLGLLPHASGLALDVGARDGYLSIKLADRGLRVTALDLESPCIADSRIRCVQGDVTRLAFADGEFEFVLCAEVLEHLPPRLLQRACSELARVSSRWLLIGVPYRQDLRVGQTTCGHCGRTNPPWGHVNTFDEAVLAALFPQCRVRARHFVGQTRDGTNALATTLLNFAGNPFGTYEQDESCVHCGQSLAAASARSMLQRLATRAGMLIQRGVTRLQPPRAKWIHLLLEK